MKKQVTTGRVSKQSANPGSRPPIRWDEIPHKELWKEVSYEMGLGSRARSSEDALRHILKRRLPNLNPTDHRRYAELECQRIVETLRMVRDQYRTYLENRGCNPLAEVYWVVLRFAVIPHAVKILRIAAVDYVLDSQIQSGEDWQLLFGYSFPGIVVPMSSRPSFRTSFEDTSRASIKKIIAGLVHEKAFTRGMTGGPFGKDGQVLIAGNRRDMDFQFSITEDINLRQELWDRSRPWTQGLATMFDASQEEVFYQTRALPSDSQQAERVFLTLTAIEKISYRHIWEIGQQRTARNLGDPVWKNLLSELDDNKISLDSELKGTAKKVLTAVRQKRHSVQTWSQCYNSKLRASLESGKTSTLRGEVTHFLHNSAKRARSELAKVWGY